MDFQFFIIKTKNFDLKFQMGITGLIPFLKNASQPTHISEFRGKTVACDVYCWLHRGAFGCADKLVLGQKTDGYITYCMKYVDLLLFHNIKPVMVFDGRSKFFFRMAQQ